MLPFTQAMPLTRVDYQFRWHILLAERTIKGVCLIDRNTGIVLTMHNQRRRLHAAGIGDLRTFPVDFGILRRRDHFVTQEAHIAILDVCLSVEDVEVAHTGSDKRLLES